MAVVAVQLYRLCVKNNWVIKMPEEVPEGVARSFTALIPAFVVAVVAPRSLLVFWEDRALFLVCAIHTS